MSMLLISTIIFTLFLHSSCLQDLPVLAPQGILVMEDKVRLGSTPPSCHNRCNQCNPCWPVQVPTGTEPVHGQTGGRTRGRPLLVDDRQQAFSQSPNYKPLGWKCRCGDRLFNP